MNLHTPKWAPTLEIGVPMDFWIFRERLQRFQLIGVKSSLYQWKVLGTEMFKMGSHDPFGYLKHKLWPKEGPLKVKNRLDFLVCRWHTTYHWKFFDEGYEFALDLTSIGGLHAKLWASKVTGVLILGISGLSHGSLGTKWHLAIGPMAKHTVNTIRGKVVASPKFEPWWVLWIYVYPWFIHAPKVLWLCINQFVV